jgi:predicted RNA-binding protein with PUA-like domain
MLRESMKKGDTAFFYHSSCDVPGIAGIVRVVKEGYPDKSAFDPKDDHYDAQSDPDDPRWFVVDVKLVRKSKRLITLDELRRHASDELSEMRLLQRGNRLSVTPVSTAEWEFILTLE